jgi:thiol-disulfide isomerase/thioredoxin
MNPKVLLLSVFSVFIVVLLSGCITESPRNGSNDLSWLENYTPLHPLDTGDNGFWIDHPIDGSMSHPQWVIDDLQSNCVVFVVHRHTCAWCDPQAQRVIALAEKYKDSVNFYDLDIDLGGDTEMKGYDSLIYDPDGPPHYIALTGIIPHVPELLK